MSTNTNSLTNRVYSELEKRITNLEIPPGGRINVSELEEEFGVSRTPLREALNKLASQGLVDIVGRVGYYAVELQPQDIKEICEMRELLETYALHKSFDNLPSSKVDKLKQESVRLKEGNLDPDVLRRRFDRTDEDLHTLFITYADNRHLQDFAQKIHNLIALTRHLNERIDTALQEHLRILDAIQAGDKRRSQQALEEHLDNVRTQILCTISNGGDG